MSVADNALFFLILADNPLSPAHFQYLRSGPMFQFVSRLLGVTTKFRVSLSFSFGFHHP